MDKWYKIAEAAYQAYAEAVSYKAFNGDNLPAWSDVDEKIQQAWIAAVKRAVSYNDDIAKPTSSH